MAPPADFAVCCPSRTSFLTGKCLHNRHEQSAHASPLLRGCMHTTRRSVPQLLCLWRPATHGRGGAGWPHFYVRTGKVLACPDRSSHDACGCRILAALRHRRARTYRCNYHHRSGVAWPGGSIGGLAGFLRFGNHNSTIFKWLRDSGLGALAIAPPYYSYAHSPHQSTIFCRSVVIDYCRCARRPRFCFPIRRAAVPAEPDPGVMRFCFRPAWWLRARFRRVFLRAAFIRTCDDATYRLQAWRVRQDDERLRRGHCNRPWLHSRSHLVWRFVRGRPARGAIELPPAAAPARRRHVLRGCSACVPGPCPAVPPLNMLYNNTTHRRRRAAAATCHARTSSALRRCAAWRFSLITRVPRRWDS